jgi:hypothetical protein
MKNFLLGILVGASATYVYLTQLETLQATLDQLWLKASAPPPVTRPAR